MNTAQGIIERFGGVSALARLLGKAPSTVQYWLRRGTIPAKWQGRLLALAHEQGIGLIADDFIPVPSRRTALAATNGALTLTADGHGFATLPIPAIEIPAYRLADGRRILGLVIINDVDMPA
jgi:hypothetical protein